MRAVEDGGTVLLALLLAACGACTPTSDPDRFNSATEATVRYVDVEGGCWVLETTDRRFEPVDLPAGYQEDGRRVTVEMEELTGIATVCQVGTVVRIRTIR